SWPTSRTCSKQKATYSVQSTGRPLVMPPSSTQAQPATTTPSSQKPSLTSKSSSKTSQKSPPSLKRNSQPTSNPASPSAHITCSTRSPSKQTSTCS
ncbi:O-methyltransferase, partial [Pyrenophora tritici-repentis]